MEFRFGRRLDYILLGVVFPLCLNFLAYFGFVTAVTAGVFSRATFLHQYVEGIYKYRLIGRWLLLSVDSMLHSAQTALGYNLPSLRFLPFIDVEAEATFYYSYFLVNTIFLVLCCFGLIILFRRDLFRLSASEKRLRVALLTLMMVFIEYVVVPYDHLSLFLLIVGCSATLTYFERDSQLAFLIVAVCLVIGALTRETATLTVSFFALIAALSRDFGKHRAKTAVLIGIYCTIYAVLRLVFGFHHAVFDIALMIVKVPLRSAIGLFCSIGFGYALIRSEQEWSRAKLLFLFSAPYIFGIVFFGLWFEVRLFAPLLLLMAIALPLDADLLFQRTKE